MTHVEINIQEKSLDGFIEFRHVMKCCKKPNVATVSQTLLFVCFFCWYLLVKKLFNYV